MSFKSFMAFWNGEDAPAEESERPPLSEQIKKYYKKKKDWFLERWKNKKKSTVILMVVFVVAYFWIVGIVASIFRAVTGFSGRAFFDGNVDAPRPQFEFFHAIASLIHFPHNIFAFAFVSLVILLLFIWWIRNHVTMGDYSVETRAGATFKKQVQDATLGSAREMTEEELKKKFNLLTSSELEKSNPNTMIFGYHDELKRYVLGKKISHEEVPNQNSFIIGDAGSRKSTNVIYTNLEQICRAGENAIITDTSGEIFADKYASFQNQGYDVWVINTIDTLHSDTSNFIGAVGNDLDLAKTITQTLVEATHNRDDKVDTFFEDGMKALLPGIILLVNTEMKAYSSIGGILKFLIERDSKDKIGQAFELYKDSQPEAYEQYMLFQTSRVADDFVSNLSHRLDIFVSTGIKRICSEESLDLVDAFGTDKKSVLFIITDKNYAFIGALYLNLAAKLLKAHARDHCKGRLLPKKIYFCLDEFLTMGYVPNMGTYLSELRKFGFVFWLICQAIPQFYRVYDQNEAKEIMSNCVYKFFYGTGDTDTAAEFEKYCGIATVRTMMKSTSNPIIKQTDQAREGVQQRMLWNADELMTLDIEDFILFTTHEHPVKLKKTFYKTIPGIEPVVDEETHYSGYIPHNYEEKTEEPETVSNKENEKSEKNSENYSSSGIPSTPAVPTFENINKEELKKLTELGRQNNNSENKPRRSQRKVEQERVLDSQMTTNLITRVEEQTKNRPFDNEDELYDSPIGEIKRYFKNDSNPGKKKQAFRVVYDIPYDHTYEGNLPNNTYKSRNSQISISKDLAGVKVFKDGYIHVGWSRIYINNKKERIKDDYYFKKYAEKSTDNIKDVIRVPESDITICPIMRKIVGLDSTNKPEYQPRNEAIRNLMNSSGKITGAIRMDSKLD